MTSRPKVSVLIPNYNYARYIGEAIESVLNQDFSDLEIIISDDASTDASVEIISKYASVDPRIHLYVQPTNLGMVGNWNWCLQRAKGDYIKFLGADDSLGSPRAISALAELIDADPDVVLATSARDIIDEKSKKVGHSDELKRPWSTGSEMIAQCLAKSCNLIGEPAAVLFRRSAGLRGFDPNYRQVVDLEMWFHILEQGNLAHTNQSLVNFRKHSRQQSAINSQACMGPGETVRLLAKYLPHLEAGVHRHSVGRLIFHNVHYSRRHSERTPEMLRLEAQLLTRLAIGRYFFLHLRHRFSKPLTNLRRTLSKRILRNSKVR